jgi:hypothetical protein
MMLAAYQKELLNTAQAYGMLLMLWRRQGRKTSTFAWQALRWMGEHPGCLVTFATCALALGAELTEREVQILMRIISAMRESAGGAGRIDSTADALEWFDVADLYTRNRLEVTLHHDRTCRSRTKIIAANYATARGYSGYVLLDEIGFIRDFKLFFEAVEPIFSANPDYRLWMATTPPEDDAHFSHELAAYPPDAEFPVTPRGNWYTNESGVPVHRVSAADGCAAGVGLYHPKTRAIVTPEQHRALSLDKTAWDRNYGLTFTQGGISAINLVPLHAAQRRGAELGCIWCEDTLPSDWATRLVPGAETGVGADPATTDKDKSNPFAVCVTQLIDGVYAAKVVLRFHSPDGQTCRALLRYICETVRPRCLSIDATSERFWAGETRADFGALCPVELVVASEKAEYRDESITYKTYLGNLAVNAVEDRQSALPPDKACRDDFRLVRRHRGGFDNSQDNAGHHGDSFDAYKHSIYALVCDCGKVEASAVRVGDCSAHGLSGSSHSGRMSMRPDDHEDSRSTTLNC